MARTYDKPPLIHAYDAFGEKDEDYIVVVNNYRVKHRHTFNLQYFYLLMKEWFIEEGYMKTRKDYNFPETFMWKKETQSKGDEIWYRWRFTKKLPGGFLAYHIRLHAHIIHLKGTEVIHEGQKYKMNTGEVELKVQSLLLFDQDKSWRNHWLMKHIKPLYIKRFARKRILRHRQKLLRDCYKLQETMKAYLKHPSYSPHSELQGFWWRKDLSHSG